MAKMTIMKGLPASGKSTRAEELLKNGNTVRLNKDILRTMLHCDKFTGRNEGHTRDAMRKLADWFLSNQINIIIDDTNLNPNTVQSWIDFAKIHNAKIEYEDMTGVDVETCIKRDRNREKRVGPTVIYKMAMQYLGLWKGEKVVLCDLDGTLCNIDHRLHFAHSEPKDWKSFFSNIPKDKVRIEVLDKLLELDKEAKIILVTARPEEYREMTEVWLDEVLKGYQLWSVLIMRESGDKRPDTEVKSDIYEKYLKHLDIIKVFDDRPSVIRMWRDKGLLVEDIGKGVEF